MFLAKLPECKAQRVCHPAPLWWRGAIARVQHLAPDFGLTNSSSYKLQNQSAIQSQQTLSLLQLHLPNFVPQNAINITNGRRWKMQASTLPCCRPAQKRTLELPPLPQYFLVRRMEVDPTIWGTDPELAYFGSRQYQLLFSYTCDQVQSPCFTKTFGSDNETLVILFPPLHPAEYRGCKPTRIRHTSDKGERMNGRRTRRGGEEGLSLSKDSYPLKATVPLSSVIWTDRPSKRWRRGRLVEGSSGRSAINVTRRAATERHGIPTTSEGLIVSFTKIPHINGSNSDTPRKQTSANPQPVTSGLFPYQLVLDTKEATLSRSLVELVKRWVGSRITSEGWKHEVQDFLQSLKVCGIPTVIYMERLHFHWRLSWIFRTYTCWTWIQSAGYGSVPQAYSICNVCALGGPAFVRFLPKAFWEAIYGHCSSWHQTRKGRSERIWRIDRRGHGFAQAIMLDASTSSSHCKRTSTGGPQTSFVWQQDANHDLYAIGRPGYSLSAVL